MSQLFLQNQYGQETLIWMCSSAPTPAGWTSQQARSSLLSDLERQHFKDRKKRMQILKYKHKESLKLNENRVKEVLQL